jgi:hypothetical protein
MLHARLLLLTFQLGHGGSAWGGVQQPKAPMVCQAGVVLLHVCAMR